MNNTPVWARIYYLLRSGHAKDALEFATENEPHIQKLEKSFVPYFKAWLDSPDRRFVVASSFLRLALTFDSRSLPKLLRDRFLSEYNQRIRYLTDTSDPYKHALYKLIGRVELSRRNVPGVTQTTEDWLWFQLSLVRENEGPGEAPHERYGLRDLGRVLVKFGEGHFDPKGNRPVLYFQVLLLSGQFERVIPRDLRREDEADAGLRRLSRSFINTRSSRPTQYTLPSPSPTTDSFAFQQDPRLPTSNFVRPSLPPLRSPT